MSVTRVASALVLGSFLVDIPAGMAQANPPQGLQIPTEMAGDMAAQLTSIDTQEHASAATVTDRGCAYAYPLPRAVGCDGVLLTAAENVSRRTSGITTTPGPLGLQALRFSAGQTMTLKTPPCLQLGKDGRDFSLSMWLKASPEGSQILAGGVSQYGGSRGFNIYTDTFDGRVRIVLHTAGEVHERRKDVYSDPFEPNTWTYVQITYTTNELGSVGTVVINGASTSDTVYAQPYQDQNLIVGEVPGFGSINPFEIADFRAWGRTLSPRELRAQWLHASSATGLSGAELDAGLAALRGHFDYSRWLTPAAFDEATAKVNKHAVYLPTSETRMRAALALLALYEERVGPLFVSEATRRGIARDPQAGEATAVREARAMLEVFQIVHDEVYRAESIATCFGVVAGQRWKTAEYFPGKVTATVIPQRRYAVRVNASVASAWGVPVAFAGEAKLRPTGLYLPPGAVARVVVPPALINKGFVVQVGAHSVDHSGKWVHLRMHRVVRRFEIERSITTIASPLGGGLYIEVPYLASAGMVSIEVTGAVEAPILSMRSFDTTTAAQWEQRRQLGVPWADFVSDHFMMQLPTNWVYAKPDAARLLRDWDVAMQAFTQYIGFPKEMRNDVVLYMQPDVHIRHGAYGVGYPQVNNLYDPSRDHRGDAKEPMALGPLFTSADFHELGHAQMQSHDQLEYGFRGETEAIVNFPFTYVANTRFGLSLTEAFRRSFDNPDRYRFGFTPDRAAVDWMVTLNFAAGREMDYSNTEFDQFRYQHRGYAKYADIARLFGWKALLNHNHQIHLNHMAHAPASGLTRVDERILRLSIASGADLTPLIHFWGIHPEEPAKLRARMVAARLGFSPQVRTLLLRYRALIPADSTAFVRHFNAVYPGMPRGESPNYGAGWYHVRKAQWNTTEAAKARAQIDRLLAQYYPG